ncbi:MAG: hypothetical protein IPH13_20030 [Planctomycetes bacterium]|nr:hypothetical protein [Planctomycetota bacterium]
MAAIGLFVVASGLTGATVTSTTFQVESDRQVGDYLDALMSAVGLKTFAYTTPNTKIGLPRAKVSIDTDVSGAADKDLDNHLSWTRNGVGAGDTIYLRNR